MHRAESILNAVKTALTGLATTGQYVERDRVFPPEACPALSVNQGSEEPLDQSSTQFQDCVLEVEVVIQVKSGTSSSDLNQIKAEVYAAMMTDTTQGLTYVHETQWGGDSAPEPSGDAEINTTRCTMRFAVAYRHSYTSKES